MAFCSDGDQSATCTSHHAFYDEREFDRDTAQKEIESSVGPATNYTGFTSTDGLASTIDSEPIDGGTTGTILTHSDQRYGVSQSTTSSFFNAHEKLGEKTGRKWSHQKLCLPLQL